MPESISGSGDLSSASFSSDGSVLLSGYVQSYSTGTDTGTGVGNPNDGGWVGDPLEPIWEDDPGRMWPENIEPRVIYGGVSQDNYPLSASRGVPGVPQLETPQSQQKVFTNQIVHLDIRNTIVQPLEPCRSVPYLKLTFRPVEYEFKHIRELKREVAIPVPKKILSNISDYRKAFEGKVHTNDNKYLLRWKLVLPVQIIPQDIETLPYKSVDVYDFRTSIQLNDPILLKLLDISQLPLVQITVARDVVGGTLLTTDYELELDQIIYADIDQSSGKLITKDPVEAGIFLP